MNIVPNNGTYPETKLRSVVSSHTLPGIDVALGAPREVHEGYGHLWFPGFMDFPTGELALTALLSPDSVENHYDGYCVSVSDDRGESWTEPYQVGAFGGGCIPRILQEDGSVAGPDFFFYDEGNGRFRGHFERFDNGGRHYSRESFASVVEGLPRAVAPLHQQGYWSRSWPSNLVFYGHALDFGDEVITATHLIFEGEERCSEIALASSDRGRTWRYLSTIADADPEGHASAEPAVDWTEGPNESSLIELDDGDLMCVMRVGASRETPLARAYSSDRGRTWSKIDRLPAWSVAPCMRKLSDGTIALSTGRPGVFLWLSTDGRGEQWQPIDILAHHNALLDTRHRIDPEVVAVGLPEHYQTPSGTYQTTSYTELIELEPGKLLLAYDRIPLGWSRVPAESADRNRIYILPIDIRSS